MIRASISNKGEALIGAGILLNIYPGPDTLYIIGRTVSQGRGAGVCAALGISTGAVVHTLLGAFGLSALLATSASAFTVLKYLGCVYLVYQGIQLIRTSGDPPAAAGWTAALSITNPGGPAAEPG